MTTKKTRKARKQSDLRFKMAIMEYRQSNLATMVADMMMSLDLQVSELRREIQKLKEGKQ